MNLCYWHLTTIIKINNGQIEYGIFLKKYLNYQWTKQFQKTCKSDNPRRPKLKSKTYKLMKWCLRIIRTIKRKELSYLSISKKWDFINQLKEVLAEYGWRDFDVFKISTEIFNYEIDHDLLINELKRLSARLKIKLDIEDRQFIIEQIEKNVEKRLERYETCKKLMIDSILEREHKKITIDRLVVLKETERHFKEITAQFPID